MSLTLKVCFSRTNKFFSSSFLKVCSLDKDNNEKGGTTCSCLLKAYALNMKQNCCLVAKSRVSSTLINGGV